MAPRAKSKKNKLPNKTTNEQLKQLGQLDELDELNELDELDAGEEMLASAAIAAADTAVILTDEPVIKLRKKKSRRKYNKIVFTVSWFRRRDFNGP